jgi:hypothetical protein
VQSIKVNFYSLPETCTVWIVSYDKKVHFYLFFFCRYPDKGSYKISA